jgi:hypothetical protein
MSRSCQAWFGTDDSMGKSMPRSRFASRSTVAGTLTAAAAAGLVLTGCHSSSGTGAAAPSSSSAPNSAAAGSAPASGSASGTATAGSGSSAVTVGYFPAEVGDTWVYQVSLDGSKGTVTNQVVAVAPTAGGTEVTMKDTNTVTGTSQVSTFQYIIHPDGSISIPVNFGAGSTLKLKSGGLAWPSPAQLASGQPVNNTIVMTGSVGGKSMTVTANAVVKGDGTQAVSVPAGSYSATVIDEVETEKLLGVATSFDIKTWVANGMGPVKEEMTSNADGSSVITTSEQLTSFTKG